MLRNIDLELVIYLGAVGLALLTGLVAYLLPGVRVMRSIAGVLCILAGVVVVLFSFDSSPRDQFGHLAMMVLLGAMIVAVRPERKPKPTAAAQVPAYPARPQAHQVPQPQQPNQYAQSAQQPQQAQPTQHVQSGQYAESGQYPQPGGQQTPPDQTGAGG